MSLSKAIFNKLIKDKCEHQEELKKSISKQKSYFYCYNCDNTFLINDNKIFRTYKLRSDDISIKEKLENDPILSAKLMIQRQIAQTKEINEKFFVNNNKDNMNKISLNNSNYLNQLVYDEEIFEKYFKIRNKLLLYIHKLCNKLEYNDNSFYSTLYFIDTYLSRIYSEEIAEKDLYLVILGFFLIASKFFEDDTFEPDFNMFLQFENSIVLTKEEVRSSEVQCLNLVNYNLIVYTAYDWLNTLLNNGIIFEGEINDKNDLSKIHNYTLTLLTTITTKIYFFQFTSLEIALSIVHISRDKLFAKKEIKSENLFELILSIYGIKFQYYEECYKKIKEDIELNEKDFAQDNNLICNNLEINFNKINSGSNTLNLDIKKNRKKMLKLDKKENKDGIKYLNTDINIKSSNNFRENRYRVLTFNNHLNLADKIKSYKSNRKNFFPINNINKYIINKDNTNKSYKNKNKSIKYIQTESNYLITDYCRNGKELNLNYYNRNGDIYINYAPKFLIKNINPNINYINNISIKNEIFRDISSNRKIKKNVTSRLNFNILKNLKHNNSKKVVLSLGKISTQKYKLNHDNKIKNNTNNILVNIKKDFKRSINITKTQNFQTINQTHKTHSKIFQNKKEKCKTHLALETEGNIHHKENNIFTLNDCMDTLLSPERQKKSPNNQKLMGYHNIIFNNKNNNKNKKNNFKIHLGKNNSKPMNSNININLNNHFGSRKFMFNFNHEENKPQKERENHFFTKNSINESKDKRFSSIHSNGSNKGINRNNYHSDKGKDDRVKIIFDHKSKGIKNILFSNLGSDNNIFKNKNSKVTNKNFPKLIFSKKSNMINK